MSDKGHGIYFDPGQSHDIRIDRVTITGPYDETPKRDTELTTWGIRRDRCANHRHPAGPCGGAGVVGRDLLALVLGSPGRPLRGGIRLSRQRGSGLQPMNHAHPVWRDRLRLLGELVVFVWTLGVIVAAMSLDYRP